MINDSNANDATTGAPPITIASDVVILDVSATVETEVVGCGSLTDSETVDMQVGIPVSTEQPDVHVIVNEIPCTNGDTKGDLMSLGRHSGGSLPEDEPSTAAMEPADCLKPVDLQSANATDNETTEEHSVDNQAVALNERHTMLHVSDDCRSSTDLREAYVSDSQVDIGQSNSRVNIVDSADCDSRPDSHTAEELDKMRAGEVSAGGHAQNLVSPIQVDESVGELHKLSVLRNGEDGVGELHEPFDSSQNHALSQVAGNAAELQNADVLSKRSNSVLPPVSGIDHESNGEPFVGFQNPESISGVAANAVLPLPPHAHFAWHANQWLLAEPLHKEFIKRCNEKEQVNKLYEDTISQINAAREKEIQEMYAQMRDKYSKKLRDAESSCTVKKTELEANHIKLVMNWFLADAFRSKCRDLISSGSSDVVQPGAPSGPLQQQQFLSSSQSSLRHSSVASPLSQPAQFQLVVSLASSQPATIQQTNVPKAHFTPRSLNPSLTHSRPPQISTVTPTIDTALVGGSFVRAPAPHIQPFRPPSSVSSSQPRNPSFSAVDLLKNVPNRTEPVSNNEAGDFGLLVVCWMLITTLGCPLNRPNLRIPKKKKRQATDLPTPSQSQKRPTSASVEDVSFNITASETARKNFKDYFMHRSTHRERGIDFKHVSKEIEAIIKHHDWDKLVEVRTNDLNLTMVLEFYAILSESSSLESVQSVKLRRTTVPFNPKAINEYFEIPEIPLAQVYSRVWNLDDDKALTAKALEAKRFLAPKSTTINKRFMFGSSTKDVRVMKHLVSHNLFPSFKINTFNYEEACLTYAIMKKVPVDVGQIIFRKACEFAFEMKNGVNIPFPYLISDLCFEAQVKQLSSDDVYAPNEPLIGPSIQELKEKTPESEPSSSHTLPPSGEPITETSAPTSESSQFQVRGTRIHKLESDLDVLRKGLMNLNDNLVRGFEHIIEALDNLRVGIRGHWEYHVQNTNCNDDDGFVNCLEDPFVAPQWSPIIFSTPPPTSIPTPPNSVPGGTSNVSNAGTTPVQSEQGRANVGVGNSSSAP